MMRTDQKGSIESQVFVLQQLKSLGLPILVVEEIEFNNLTSISYKDSLLATFHWDSNNIPIFDFLGKFNVYNNNFKSETKTKFNVGSKVKLTESSKYSWSNDAVDIDAEMVVTHVRINQEFGTGVGLRVSLALQPNYPGNPLSVFYDSAYFVKASLVKN